MTGSHQCTLAVCSTFAEIHSTLTPQCIDALFGVRIPFQSLIQSPEGNPDSSPPVQSPVYVYTGHRTPVGNWYPRPSYIYPMTPETPGLSITFGTLLACRFFETKDCWTFSHCFYWISFCSRVYMYVLGINCPGKLKTISLGEGICTAKANHSWKNIFTHRKSKSTQNEVFL